MEHISSSAVDGSPGSLEIALIYRIRVFNAFFTTACDLPLSYARLIQSMPFHQIPSPYNQTKRNRFVLPSPFVGQQAGLCRPSPHSRYRTTTLPPALQVGVTFKQSRRGAQSYKRSYGEDHLKLMRTNRASAQVELRSVGEQHTG